jgi:hypothetical protein
MIALETLAERTCRARRRDGMMRPEHEVLQPGAVSSDQEIPQAEAACERSVARCQREREHRGSGRGIGVQLVARHPRSFIEL